VGGVLLARRAAAQRTPLARSPATHAQMPRNETKHVVPPLIATSGRGLKGRAHDVRRGRTLSIHLLHATPAHAPQRGARDGRGGAGPLCGGTLRHRAGDRGWLLLRYGAAPLADARRPAGHRGAHAPKRCGTTPVCAEPLAAGAGAGLLPREGPAL